MSELTYREAVARALAEELERDERVILFGEVVAAAGGVSRRPQVSTSVSVPDGFGRHDQIANQLAKCRYMTGDQGAVPVTVRMTNDGGGASRLSTRSRSRTGSGTSPG